MTETLLRVKGSGYTRDSQIEFGGQSYPDDTVYVSSRELNLSITNEVFPNVDPAVEVRVSDGERTSNARWFAFVDPGNVNPTLTAVYPAQNWIAESASTVAVFGSGFTSDAVVVVDHVGCPTVFVSATALTATLPVVSTVGQSSIFVQQAGTTANPAQSNALSLQWIDLWPTLLTSSPDTLVRPPGGGEANATYVELHGSDFDAAAIVLIADDYGAYPITTNDVYSVAVPSSELITCKINPWYWAAFAGIRVVVRNPGSVQQTELPDSDPLPIYFETAAAPTLAITSPTAGSTVEPVHDVLGVAPPGSIVELWYSAEGGPDTSTSATKVADTFGTFLFVGDSPALPGVIDWFVRVGETVSAKVRVTVVESAEASYDAAAHTIEEIKAYVTANPDDRDAIYDSESVGRARSTLLAWLEAPDA